jgi:NitT/TauT family transport system substrate-binding protein
MRAGNAAAVSENANLGLGVAMHRTITKQAGHLRRGLRCLPAALGALALLVQTATAADKVRMAIPGVSPNSAFFMVALEKGYYKKEGIDVEVLQAGGGTSTPALMSGDLQFSASTGAAISAILKGAHFKIIMVGQDRPGAQIWTSKPEIKSLESLKGQQIGIQSRGDTGEMAVLSLLKARGLPLDYVSFTPMGTGGPRMAALKSGTLPAVLLNWFEIAELRPAGLFNFGHPVIDLYHDVRMPYNGIVTSDALIKSKPDLVMKFVRASLKGVAYTLAFKPQSIKIVADYGKLSPDVTAFDFNHMIASALPNGTVSPQMQTNEIALRSELLGIPKDKVLPNSAVFDFSLIEKAAAQLKAEGWKPSP